MTTAVCLTFFSLRRGERSLGVSTHSTRRPSSSRRHLASQHPHDSPQNFPHHRGHSRGVDGFRRDTYAILGRSLRRLWFILLFLGRICKCTAPLTVQVHHAHKMCIGYVGMIRIRAREGVLDARADVPVVLLTVGAHLRRISRIALHGQNPLAKPEVTYSLHDLAA